MAFRHMFSVQAIGLGCVLFSFAFGKPPNQGLDSKTVCIEYNALFRGQRITETKTRSYEQGHSIRATYAPASFLRANIGAGAERMRVDQHEGKEFRGEFGFAPSGGFGLVTPTFGNGVLQAEGGLDIGYVNSGDKTNLRYRGPTYLPFAGIGFRLGEFTDLQIGWRGLFMDGNIVDGDGADLGPFSNETRTRGFLNVIVQAMEDRTYFSFDFDASPNFSMEWGKGPQEATVTLGFGFIIREDKKFDKIREKGEEYFPGFEAMRDRLEDGAKKP